MSRVIVLGLDHKSIGEFDAICTLGYSLCGNAAVSPGGNASIPIPQDYYSKDWFDFGRPVIVQPEDMPAYFGWIDTPWNAKKPISMTVYDVETLMGIRSPDMNIALTAGSIDIIITQILNLFNTQEETYIRLGTVGAIDTTYRQETLDTRTYWEQLQALALRSGTEMIFRPQKVDGRWMVYLDIAARMGVDTNFLLADGDRGNMSINNAQVRGEIINRMIGINSQSTAQSLLKTDPQSNNESRARYRTRSKVVQFRDVTNLSTLTQNTKNALSAASEPYLELQVSVTNIDHAFRNLRLGNEVMTHASSVILNRGVRGWRGKTRIIKMAYNEASKSVGMTLIGRLYQ